MSETPDSNVEIFVVDADALIRETLSIVLKAIRSSALRTAPRSWQPPGAEPRPAFFWMFTSPANPDSMFSRN